MHPGTAGYEKQGERARAARPAGESKGWKRYINSLLAAEISSLTRYYDRLLQWLPRDDDTGLLFAEIVCDDKEIVENGRPFPNLTGETETRTAVLINGAFNHHFDIQGALEELKTKLSRTTRVVVVLYNPYLRGLYHFANRIGARKGELPSTFITRTGLEALAKLSGFEIVRQRVCIYCPFRLLGLGNVINRIFALLPVIRFLSLTYVVVLRPLFPSHANGLSCVIPARNERGNIENALRRFPDLGCKIEIIFVEGHSSDGTWDEIRRVAECYKDRFEIKMFKQTGKGKADAVRLGFAHATQQLLTILDADLTMPPEMLSRFYRAYTDGHGDFINGSRLTYPMEGEAMRFLNRLGNVFFAKALSWVLDSRISDSLCGTKLFTRHDYRRMTAWRDRFGNFDPFGDFELLFPAAIFGLGIVDVPIRYLARTYGSTSIHRFRHGFELLRMTLVGLLRIKTSASVTPSRPDYPSAA